VQAGASAGPRVTCEIASPQEPRHGMILREHGHRKQQHGHVHRHRAAADASCSHPAVPRSSHTSPL
jgi:hypothetical protein